MRSPIDVLAGRVGGFKKMEVARRTVPCYKHVIEKDGEKLSVCLLVDSGKLYRFPFETHKGVKGLAVKARFLRGEMEHMRLGEIERLRYQLASTRAEAGQMREERDELRAGIERALTQMSEPEEE